MMFLPTTKLKRLRVLTATIFLSVFRTCIVECVEPKTNPTRFQTLALHISNNTSLPAMSVLEMFATNSIATDSSSAVNLQSSNVPNITMDIAPLFPIDTSQQNASFIEYEKHFLSNVSLLSFGEDLSSAAAAVWPQESTVHGAGAEFTPFVGVEQRINSTNVVRNGLATARSALRWTQFLYPTNVRRKMFAELTYGPNNWQNEVHQPNLYDKESVKNGQKLSFQSDEKQVHLLTNGNSPHENVTFPEPRRIIPRVLKPLDIESGIIPLFQKHQILSLDFMKPPLIPIQPPLSRDYPSSSSSLYSSSNNNNNYNSNGNNNYNNLNNQQYGSSQGSLYSNSNSYPSQPYGSNSNYGSSSSGGNSYGHSLPAASYNGYNTYNGGGGYVQNLFPYYYGGGAGLYSPSSSYAGSPMYPSSYASSGTNPLSSLVAAALLNGYGSIFPYGSYYNGSVTYSTSTSTTARITTTSTTPVTTPAVNTTIPTTTLSVCVGNAPIQITTMPTPCTITACVDLLGMPPLMATPNTVACQLSTTGGLAGTVMLSILMNGNFLIMNGNLVLNTLMNDGAMPMVTVTAVDGCGRTASTQITVPIMCAVAPPGR